VKKPFVAPPPSRHAYVPPPSRDVPPAKVYRRDEDPEIKEREAETLDQAEKAGLVPGDNAQAGDDEDQPKPTSLKERIALLQKQQLEQAQRHADAATKKEKPKRPPKKRTESSGPAEGAVEQEEAIAPASLERVSTEDTSARTSTDEAHPARMQPLPRRKSSKGPAVESVHDGNEADMSGAGDTTEGQDDVTEREDNSDELVRRPSQAPAIPIPVAAPAPVDTDPPARAEDNKSENGREEEQDEEEEEEEEEEDVDPEVKRKEELRARMAKMSGGMGFHGMFGAPMPPMGGAPPKKKKTPKADPALVEEEEPEAPAARAAPPIPTMMALPGLGGPRKSSENPRPSDEYERETRSPPPPIPSRAVEETREEEYDSDDAESQPPPAPASIGKYSQATIIPAIANTIQVPPREQPGSPPPIPGSRPAPPPVPAECKSEIT
jgi:hypothetical protein